MKILNENIQNKNLGRILDQDEGAKRKMLVEAWKGSGYLYGLSGRDASNMAVLMESQKRQLLKEGTTTADMAVFDTIAIPMIRRQYAAMITPHIVSVQPLSQPHGVVFFMDYKVSTTKNPLRSDYLGDQSATGGSNPEVTNMTGNDFTNSQSVYDQFYGSKNYDLSKGKIIARGYTGTTIATGDTANAAIFKAEAALGATDVQQTAIVDFNLSTIGGLKMDSLAGLKVYAYPTGNTTTPLVYGKDFIYQRVPMNWGNSFSSTALAGSGDTTSTGGVINSDGVYNGPGGQNNILRLQIVPVRPGVGNVDLYLGFKEYLNLELYPAFSSEMKMQISRQTIDTEIHKLKTAWTVEFAQDLMSYYAIDAESELTQALAEEIAAEKDRMVINELVQGAGHLEVWNANFRDAVDPNPAATVFRGLEGDYNQSLVYAINNIDGKIRKSTRRGGANWVVISAEGFTKMRNMQTFVPIDNNGDDMSNMFAAGIERVGTVESKYTVYVDSNMPAEICLVGKKGTSFFDTGYVYAPYIEYMLSPTVYEDQDFNPRKMISSRFGTAMLQNRFYGVVFMKGIETFIPVQPDLVNNSF